MDITIRLEEEKDFRSVEELTREAFWNLHVPGCDEHFLVHQMRKHLDFVNELNFVALLDDKIVGHIAYSRTFLLNDSNHKLDTLTFGPISVLPEYQRKGIGSALIRKTVQLAKEMNIPAIIIYGHPGNYVKHGFKSSKDYMISDPEGKYPFGLLVLELKEGFFNSEKWKFYCSDIYSLDPILADEYDKQFPEKKKAFHYSQVEFSIACRAYLE